MALQEKLHIIQIKKHFVKQIVVQCYEGGICSEWFGNEGLLNDGCWLKFREDGRMDGWMDRWMDRRMDG